jgi:hypothetical protein
LIKKGLTGKISVIEAKMFGEMNNGTTRDE